MDAGMVIDAQQVLDTLNDRDRGLRGADFVRAETRWTGRYLVVGGEPYAVLPDALEHFFNLLGGIPVAFFKRWPPDLRETIVNRLIQDRAGHLEASIARMLVREDNTITAFREYDQVYVPGTAVVRAVLGVVGRQDLEIPTFTTTETAFGLELVATRKATEPRVGDITRGGLRVDHADRGLGSAAVQPFLYRLRCSNGLQINECRSSHHRSALQRYPSGEVFLQAVASHAASSWRSMEDSLLALFSSLDHRPIADMVAVVRELLGQSRLGQKMEARLLQALAREPELGSTQFALVNALTNVATHGDVTPRERTLLMRMASLQTMEAAGERCPRCRQDLRAQVTPAVSGGD